MAIRVTQLESEAHDIKGFDCGNGELNDFLRNTAGQHQRKLISKTYVLADGDAPGEIIGFYTLALRGMVAKGELPAELAKRLPRAVPAFTLARLAIGSRFKQQGHGEYLLYHAIDRTDRVAAEVGGYAILVDATSDTGALFYKKYGVIPFPDDPLIQFLPFASLPK